MLTLKDFKEETSELGTYLVKQEGEYRLTLQPCMSGYCIGLHDLNGWPLRDTLCTSRPKETFKDEITNMQITLDLANDVWENRYETE